MNSFQLGDTVRFTSSRDLVVGRVEEIREGFDGNNLLVVRQDFRCSDRASSSFPATPKSCNPPKDTPLRHALAPLLPSRVRLRQLHM